MIHQFNRKGRKVNEEIINWHSIIQDILDEHLPLLSGKKIKEGAREFSRYIKIDYYCEVEGDLPLEDEGRDIIRPLNHLKEKNVIEFKSYHETLNESTFRHYVMRALAVEMPKLGVSYQGKVTLTILSSRVPETLLKIPEYHFKPITKWKYHSSFIKDLDIYILIQREMRGIRGGEGLALFQVLEKDPDKQHAAWHDLFSQNLRNADVLRKIAEQISKEEVMSLVEEMKLVGKEEGRMEEAREGIIKVLEARVKDAPAEIKDTLSAITSLENLRALLKQAALASTIDDFKEALNKMTAENKDPGEAS